MGPRADLAHLSQICSLRRRSAPPAPSGPTVCPAPSSPAARVPCPLAAGRRCPPHPSCAPPPGLRPVPPGRPRPSCAPRTAERPTAGVDPGHRLRCPRPPAPATGSGTGSAARAPSFLD
ncbi:hypothetical protein GUJ93_ZPchr0014g47021 [Zizania palustris]|uniref:Uncharacterized protein n=1 Tax=Zizania palustris TaxID=103762 RepID=A0A8J5W5U4_ZIZPA|nr:hypothetical protein GUJ93_ZPchr0014g47021 [Zizania palustris]